MKLAAWSTSLAAVCGVACALYVVLAASGLDPVLSLATVVCCVWLAAFAWGEWS